MRKIVKLLVLLCSASWAQSTVDCVSCTVTNPLPRSFRVVRTTDLATGGKIIYAILNVKELSALTSSQRASLACSLQHRYPPGSDILVMLFDNKKSAAHYVSPWEQEKPAGWKTHQLSFKAMYLTDPKSNEHHLYWYENGSGAERAATAHVNICRTDSPSDLQKQ